MLIKARGKCVWNIGNFFWCTSPSPRDYQILYYRKYNHREHIFIVIFCFMQGYSLTLSIYLLQNCFWDRTVE